MTVLAMYSPSFSAQLYEVTGIDLLSTEEFYYTNYPQQLDLPISTSFISLLEQNTPRKGRV